MFRLIYWACQPNKKIAMHVPNQSLVLRILSAAISKPVRNSNECVSSLKA